MEERIAALEIKAELLERQIATHEAALMRAGKFIEVLGKAAIEANKPGD